MKYIKPMQGKDFAEYLLRLDVGDEIYFGVDPGIEWPEEVPSVGDITGWYYAKVMQIGGQGSRFILLDYCGGEQAFAIPLSNFGDKEEDRAIVPGFVKTYFENYNIELGSMNDYVFVEMESKGTKTVYYVDLVLEGCGTIVSVFHSDSLDEAHAECEKWDKVLKDPNCIYYTDKPIMVEINHVEEEI